MTEGIQDFEVFAADVGLTDEQKEKALKYWRGEHLYVPCRLRSEVDFRRAEVVRLLGSKLTYAQVGDMTGLSERQVRRIEAEKKVILRRQR